MSKTRADQRRATRADAGRFKPRPDAKRREPDEIPAHFASDVETIKHHKENIARDDVNDGDIAPVVIVYRDGVDSPICVAFANHVNRDEGLDLMGLAVPALSADAVVLCVDSHMTDERWTDAKGRMPDPHELQHVCDNEGACELGLTTDCINLMRINRATKLVQMVSLPYHVNKTTKEVHWQPDVHVLDESAPDCHVEGTVPTALKRVMEMPCLQDLVEMEAQKRGLTVREMIDEIDPGLVGCSDEDIQFKQDLAAHQMIVRSGWAALFSVPDERNAEMEASMRAQGFDIDEDGSVHLRPNPDDPNQVLDMIRRLARERRYEQIRDDELRVSAQRRAERGEPPAEWTKPR